MAVGQSGRIVVYLDPELKQKLHARLRGEGRDFKGWLLERIQQYLEAPGDNLGPPRHSEESPSEIGEIGSELGELERRVLDAVSSDARARPHVDDLVQATGLGIGEVHKALLELELQGCVVQDLGRYRRVRPS
jgi:predicted Rossmann fold nucleotide-binding protein DprA/Smf involved in DNA uptake